MKLSGEITTNCACVDEDGVEFYNEHCDGECYRWSLEDFAQLAGAHVREGGYLVAMKGREPTEEITALQAHTAWSAQAIEPLTVPELEGQRCLVWMQRKGNT